MGSMVLYIDLGSEYTCNYYKYLKKNRSSDTFQMQEEKKFNCLKGGLKFQPIRVQIMNHLENKQLWKISCFITSYLCLPTNSHM